jgi:protein SCO1
MTMVRLLLGVGILAFLLPWVAMARYTPDSTAIGGVRNKEVPILKNVAFDQHMNAQVPGDLAFVDESGKNVQLKDYYGNGPVVLAMVYYGCPNLCTLVANGLFKALQELPFAAGSKFNVVLVSIDPSEKPKLAASKRKSYLTQYHRAGSEAGIHFLTGEEPNIKKLADSIGFKYQYDEPTKQFAHPAGITVLTPEGHISRYLFGVEYAGNDLRFAIVDASRGKIGSITDKFLLYCYHYDPIQGTYSLMVMKLLRFLAAITVLAVGGGVLTMIGRERRRRKPVRST